MNIVKVSEVESLTGYLVMDSIVKKDDEVQFIEIVNLKESQTDANGNKFLSYKIFQVINLNTREQNVYHVEVYTEGMAQGDCLASGAANRDIRVIPPESSSYQTYRYIRALFTND